MKNKKKKQLPLLLLALLFITTAAYGTRAYFTDQATQNAGVKLTLGNLSIDPAEADAVIWRYTPEKGNNNVLGATVQDTIITSDLQNINNVQPGDSFTGTFTFVNTGSLEQVVTANNTLEIIEVGPVKFDVYDAIEVFDDKGKSGDSNSTVTVVPNGSVKITVKATVDADNTYNNTSEKTLTKDNFVNAIAESISVEAVQANK